MVDRIDPLKHRMSLLLVDLIHRNHLNSRKFGDIMECSKNSIHHYKHGRMLPGSGFINKLAHLFGVNMNWLHHGVGSPYHWDGSGPMSQPPRAGSPGEQGSGEPSEFSWDAFAGEDIAAMPQAAYGAPPDDRFAAAMEKAMKILTSEDDGSFALALLIEHFDRGRRALKRYEMALEEKKQLRDKKDSIMRKIPDSD